MNKYIDADVIIARASQDSERMYLESVARHVPSIDLVRCKECRYKDMEICPMYRLAVAGVRKYDDYCSYGEREGER